MMDLSARRRNRNQSMDNSSYHRRGGSRRDLMDGSSSNRRTSRRNLMNDSSKGDTQDFMNRSRRRDDAREPRPQLLKEHSVRLSEQLPWYVSSAGEEREGPDYSFFTSYAAFIAYAFIAMAILFREPGLLGGVFLVIFSQVFLVICKWISFIAENEKVQEAIDISHGYIQLVVKHIRSFVKEENPEENFLMRKTRRITAATLVHQRNLQVWFWTKYFTRRNNEMKRKTMQNQVNVINKLARH